MVPRTRLGRDGHRWQILGGILQLPRDKFFKWAENRSAEAAFYDMLIRSPDGGLCFCFTDCFCAERSFMSVAHAPLHHAAASLVAAVLEVLAGTGEEPHFVIQRDFRSWKRSQQEVFLSNEHELWQQPVEFASSDWWCNFPEYQALRMVIQDHEALRTRLDTLVGYPSSLVRRQLDTVLVQYLLTPMVIATRAYRFDLDAFEAAYAVVEDGLLIETVRLVEYVPLLGFEISSSLAGTPLPDGLTIRPMSDAELSEAVRVMGIPISQFTSTNSFTLSRFHQNALVLERLLPVHSGNDQHPDAAVPSPFTNASRHMLTALRLVCGGSVAYGRPMHLQNQDDFDAQLYASAVLTEVQHPAEDRPTLLVDPAKVNDLHEVYALLSDPRILDMRFLQNALRRLVMAGSRVLSEDRLIDLCITAESLFIHHSGLPNTKNKQDRLVAGAKALLSCDTELHAADLHIERLIRDAYRSRNTEMHGDVVGTRSFHLLDGSTTHDLRDLVGDFERLLRRTAHLFLIRATAPGHGLSAPLGVGA
ncbi:hypothetical protein [Streptomyces sp. NBC_01497]|uniref:hypothetical protein n=1 Tax=Streptomyces sp. NBC_01497 TaxID=2903885 RepID=UPI002E2FE94B|nr:hypothetical protein [Streptomyces sp. NBC_01497]